MKTPRCCCGMHRSRFTGEALVWPYRACLPTAGAGPPWARQTNTAAALGTHVSATVEGFDDAAIDWFRRPAEIELHAISGGQ